MKRKDNGLRQKDGASTPTSSSFDEKDECMSRQRSVPTKRPRTRENTSPAAQCVFVTPVPRQSFSSRILSRHSNGDIPASTVTVPQSSRTLNLQSPEVASSHVNSAAGLSTPLRTEVPTPRGALEMSILSCSSRSSKSSRITDPVQVREIYEKAIELYQGHKISQENAFSIKVIECILEIIKLDSDRGPNMIENGRTLEIGGKIYVCRVDSMYNQLLGAASAIGGCSLRRDQNSHEIPNCDKTGSSSSASVTDLLSMVSLKKKKAKQKSVKKGRHLREDKDLEMELTRTRCVQDRREWLEGFLDEWVQEDEDFDYQEFMYRNREKPGQELQRVEKERAAHTMVTFPLEIHSKVMGLLITYPFYLHPSGVWTPDHFDVWGRLLNGVNARDLPLHYVPGLESHHFEKNYMQSCSPAEVANTGQTPVAEDALSDVPCGSAYPSEPVIDEHGNVRPIDISKMNSLDALGPYFNELRKQNVHRSHLDTWEGPTFINPNEGTRTKLKLRRHKNRSKKKSFDFTSIDWENGNNRFILDNQGRLEMVEPLVTRLHVHPSKEFFCKNLLDEADTQEFALDVYESENVFMELDKGVGTNLKSLPVALKYFIADNRDFVVGQPVNQVGDVQENGENFDLSQDLSQFEGHRELHDEFPTSQPNSASAGVIAQLNAAGITGSNASMYSAMLKVLTPCFPSPIPGMPLPFEDPSHEEYDPEAALRSSHYRPINVRYLKKKMLDVLAKNLHLNIDTGDPQDTTETSIDLTKFLEELIDSVDERTRLQVSLSILLVTLLHTVVENRLFIEGNSSAKIICRGKHWQYSNLEQVSIMQPLPSPVEPIANTSESNVLGVHSAGQGDTSWGDGR